MCCVSGKIGKGVMDGNMRSKISSIRFLENKQGIIQFTLNGMCPLLKSVFANVFTYSLIHPQL